MILLYTKQSSNFTTSKIMRQCSTWSHDVVFHAAASLAHQRVLKAANFSPLIFHYRSCRPCIHPEKLPYTIWYNPTFLWTTHHASSVCGSGPPSRRSPRGSSRDDTPCPGCGHTRSLVVDGVSSSASSFEEYWILSAVQASSSAAAVHLKYMKLTHLTL